MASSEGNQSRFTGRVHSYTLSRPGYPREILALLERECGLSAESRIADVAAGTGLFTELFLEGGNAVTAIEPNDEMRLACARLQSRYPKLTVAGGTAEHTGLPDRCADFVTVAQAFHWLDLQQARREFARILDRGGWAVVAYNERQMGGDAFHCGYEDLLLRFGVDYEAVQRRYPKESALRDFFGPCPKFRETFANFQLLSHEALVARIVSSSYMPTPGHPKYEAMRAAIDSLFAENESEGVVRINYDCTIDYGHLG
ncbi:MAG TPA: class I SAM-dependent methyltransferase [Acidobacteriaceae bacterium]|nr:class I SAM-dependent methyltransferase [Acidobacteriaceae bacterium]